MTKKQVHIRLSEDTINKLRDLADRMNTTNTEVVTLAIDRMHREEIPRGKQKAEK